MHKWKRKSSHDEKKEKMASIHPVCRDRFCACAFCCKSSSHSNASDHAARHCRVELLAAVAVAAAHAHHRQAPRGNHLRKGHTQQMMTL